MSWTTVESYTSYREALKGLKAATHASYFHRLSAALA